MKVIIILMSLISLSCFAEIERTIVFGKLSKKVVFVEHEGVRVSQSCVQNIKTCKAFKAAKTIVKKKLKTIPDNNNYAVVLCQHLKGVFVIGKGNPKGDEEYCLFDDMSLVRASQLGGNK